MFASEDLHFNACFRVQLRTSNHVVLYYHKNNLKRGSLQRAAAVTQHQQSAEDIPKDLVERRLGGESLNWHKSAVKVYETLLLCTD